MSAQIEAQRRAFEAWWERAGKSLDPEASVSWYDKRRDFAELVWHAATALSRNYIADREIAPTEFTFENGRRVWIRFDEEEDPFLEIDTRS